MQAARGVAVTKIRAAYGWTQKTLLWKRLSIKK